MNMAIHLAALFIEGTHPLIKPWRTRREIGLHERMDQFVHQCAATRRNVHDESFVGARVKAVRCAGLFAEKKPGMLFVRSRILEKPDVEYLFRIAGKEILLEQLHGPLDGIFRPLLQNSFRLITHHYEWALDHDRELI